MYIHILVDDFISENFFAKKNIRLHFSLYEYYGKFFFINLVKISVFYSYASVIFFRFNSKIGL